MTVAEMIQKFIALRERKRQIESVQKAQLKPFNEAIEQLGGLILLELDKQKLTSMRSDDGTVYKVVDTSVTVKDWPATFAYIQTNQAWDLLEARVSKTAALAVIEETQMPIPGVNVVQENVLRVRKS